MQTNTAGKIFDPGTFFSPQERVGAAARAEDRGEATQEKTNPKSARHLCLY